MKFSLGGAFLRFDEFLSELTASPKGKGLAFEHAIEWWLTKDSYWGSLMVPQSVSLWERSELRDGVDIGIDLTARDRFGNNWAIQVKNWSQDRSLPKSEIDKFLSASNTSIFQRRLLITTTTSISPNALRALQSQEKPVVLLDFEGLSQSEIWGEFLTRHKNIPQVQPKVLLPHQAAAVQGVTNSYLEGASRTQLIMACGSGKTLTAQRIAEKLNSSCTLVLVPSLLLLQQTRLDWLKDREKDFQSLAVCSDETVVIDQPSHRTVELPFPVTTDSLEIAKFLAQDGTKVIFSTYQSFEAISAAIGSVESKIDMVICDEAHRLVGAKTNSFGRVLKDESLTKSRYLFMTATPKYFVPHNVSGSDGESNEVVSMSDTEIFGKVSYSYSFASAIRDGRLADYRLIISAVTDSQVLGAIHERRLFSAAESIIDGELLASHFGLAKAMRDYGIRSLISFHSRISRAQDFAETHSDLFHEYPMYFATGDLSLSTCLTGSDTSARRKQTLSKLATLKSTEFGLVSNARCLTEGVDVPNLDGIAFIDPKSSQIDIVQAIGRVIRRGAKNKDIGYIVVPIFVSESEISSGEIPAGRFKAVIEVINALRAHDEGLVIELDSARRKLGALQTTDNGFPARITLDLPSEIPSEFAEKIQTFLIRGASQSWDENFGRLQRFFQLNGHIKVPSDSKDNDLTTLYTWMSTQRALYSKGQLRDDRCKSLENLTGWTWDPFDAAWEAGIAALRKHLESGGSSTVPRNYKVDGVNLFNWIRLHRNKSHRLTSERRAQLDALPGWQWNPFQDQWESRFVELRTILLNGSDLTLKSVTEPQRSQIREWLTYQRKHRFTRLNQEQRGKLESLPGWNWAPLDHNWEAKFALLKQYVQEFGSSRVPANTTYKGVRLGAWLAQLRGKREKLDNLKIENLESLPDWTWSPLEGDWEDNFKSLERWIVNNPDCSVTSSLIFEGKRLGEWQLRQKKNRGSLDPNRISRLESLPNWTWDSSDNWYGKFELLRQFLVESEGELPKLSVKYRGLAVGAWLDRQRRRFADLEEDKKTLLANLPGWNRISGRAINESSATTTESSRLMSIAEFQKHSEWNRKIGLLQSYVSENGTSNIPKSQQFRGFELGMWVKYIRSKRWELEESQRAELEQLHGWTWDPLESRWLERFETLRDFCAVHGTARVPQGVTHLGQPLGTWVSYQRKHKDELDDVKVRSLENLPGWTWNPKEDDWQLAYEIFAQNPELSFAGREGREIVIDGVGIGAWLRTQRLNFDKLSPEKQAALRSRPNWVW